MISTTLPNWAEVVTAAVSAIALVAVLFALLQISFLNRQIHRELEAKYLERYWLLMDRRSSRFALGGPPVRSDRRVIHAYFQLSEDQIALRRLGRVTDHTWQFWAKT
jgi:hypothetical protein